MMKRAQTPILIGLIAACASCFRLYAHQVGASDWQWVLWGARLLLQDQNPYHIPPEYLPYAQHTPLFYPLPAVFLALPIAWLPSYVAGAIFVGVSSALLAYALPLRSWWLFLSPAYITAMYNAQWSPLMTAALFLPALAPLAICKPNLGAAVPITRWAIVGGGALILISFVVYPPWFGEWIAALRTAGHPSPLTLLPFGPLLLLALFRWRDERARLFLALAILPNRMAFYDQLGLLTIPRTPRTLLVLSSTQT